MSDGDEIIVRPNHETPPYEVLDREGNVIFTKPPLITQDGEGITINRLPSLKTTRRILAGLGVLGIGAAIGTHNTVLGAVGGGLLAAAGELKLGGWILNRAVNAPDELSDQ